MEGKHLIIDSEGTRSPSVLDSVEYIYRFLEEIPKLTGMEVLIPPHVVRCHDHGNEGVTGVVVITTSHSSIHTWPNSGVIKFDLYSCKDFDAEFIIGEFKRRFKPESMKAQVIPG